ncbi:MAG: YtxH domain-containing protein [Paludibacteraceae bacterium]|nr:YtxH domain-containing protein [Paludibacteraceae bacterium]MBR1515479.1 YtxH domain-containing protein [Paludibacteraceae bacterium]
MKSSYSVAAFLGGVIVGGIAALLLAPKAGKELREDISSFAEEEAQKVKDVYNRFRQEETEPSNEA